MFTNTFADGSPHQAFLAWAPTLTHANQTSPEPSCSTQKLHLCPCRRGFAWPLLSLTTGSLQANPILSVPFFQTELTEHCPELDLFAASCDISDVESSHPTSICSSYVAKHQRHLQHNTHAPQCCLFDGAMLGAGFQLSTSGGKDLAGPMWRINLRP